MIAVIEGVRCEKIWKPRNKGIILTSLSLIDISSLLLKQDGFDFLLLSRFNQDALENVFSQVRQKAGNSPPAVKCFSALKLIRLSQFVSEVKNSNYLSDSDSMIIEYVFL